ncbi:uncharacterized protein LOC130747902 [Lotus japonicus]|uniref:uncharacterized protein LOC130747902 n=1 Tax=Lotus japonicus TaxID=34305 RepID=UPI002590EA6A|nr:uncharacterized protein LOC130747902 [Lotus japonicus]
MVSSYTPTIERRKVDIKCEDQIITVVMEGEGMGITENQLHQVYWAPESSCSATHDSHRSSTGTVVGESESAREAVHPEAELLVPGDTGTSCQDIGGKAGTRTSDIDVSGKRAPEKSTMGLVTEILQRKQKVNWHNRENGQIEVCFRDKFKFKVGYSAIEGLWNSFVTGFKVSVGEARVLELSIKGAGKYKLMGWGQSQSQRKYNNRWVCLDPLPLGCVKDIGPSITFKKTFIGPLLEGLENNVSPFAESPSPLSQSCNVVDKGSAIISPKKKRGRPRKANSDNQVVKEASAASSTPKRRGRKPKLQGSGEIHCDKREQHPPLRGPSGRYLTRSSKVWLLGKVLGLEFEGSDESAISSLERDLGAFLSPSAFGDGEDLALLELVNATGTAGGLLTMWKASTFTLIRVYNGDRYLIIEVKDNNLNINLMIGNIYGPHNEEEREALFSEIGNVMQNRECGWILGGDFNATLNAEDRSGRLGGTEVSFSSFVNDWNLIDLPLQNSEYTWFSSRNGGVWSRIDRWLLNEEAWLSLDEAIQRVENWGLSDHRAVILAMGQPSSGPKPFLFYNNWLLDKEFDRMIKEWWNTCAVQGWSGYVLQTKLKDLKGKIKGWKGHSISHTEEKIKLLESELQVVMERLESVGMNEELRAKRSQVLSGLWEGYRIEESKWRQKSRVKWLKEGDKNTSFFHFVSKSRRAKNHIHKLNVRGNEVNDPAVIRDEIRAHFQSFFTREVMRRPKLKCTNLLKLSMGDRRRLEEGFSESEIWDVLKHCDGDKAPGPDGFNFNFFKHFWATIKGDILKFFEEFHANGKLAASINWCQRFLQHDCKIPKIISENQFAFTTGRQIADCILIASEVVDFLNKNQRGGYLLKLDFAKAYDSIEWNFLLELLAKMNFGEKWISWIKTCVTTASLAILINGSPSVFFDIEKGLRQGDPLSPLLFNICVNGLSCMLNQLLGISGLNLFSGVRMGSADALNHLQFADDTLLFCEQDDSQLELLCNALFAFLFASGLRLNMEKSELIGCNVEPAEVARVAHIYGWSAGSLPITYLGASLGGNPRRLSFWEPMIVKLRKKGRSYNSKYISLSGRLTILKAALNSIPVYWMSLFKAPRGVIMEVEKIFRAFLWGKEERGKKMVWIPWNMICKSKAKGGLGLGHLAWKNKALLLKWAWRYGVEVDSLWRRQIAGKYQWDSRRLMLHIVLDEGGSLSAIIKDIGAILKEDSLLSMGFRDQLICGIGDGNSTRFWIDPWIGGKPLSCQFPRVFAICTNKTAYIADVGLFVRNKWVWDIPFRRNFLGWELGIHSEFMNMINSIIPAANSKDHLIWCGSGNGYFTVRGLCQWVDDNVQDEAEFAVPEHIAKLIPPKVKLLYWQACHNKLATKINLWRRGVISAENSLCCFCSSSIETVDHLFVSCPRVIELWYCILNREGISWSCSNSLLAVQEEWISLRKGTDLIIWNLFPYSIVWSLWLQRNNSTFRGNGMQMQEIEDMYMLRIAWWIKCDWTTCPYDSLHISRNLGSIKLPKPSTVPRQISWLPPDTGILKCNVDGASKGNPGISGVGGVIRDSNRIFLGYFAIGIGFGWAFEAEVKAILHGLMFCQQFLFRNIVLESDSTTAIGWVVSRDKIPWKLINELNKIDLFDG